MFVGYCSRGVSIPDPFPLTSLADFGDDVTIVPFHPRRAQWVKDRMNPLATATNQHSAVSTGFGQYPVHRWISFPLRQLWWPIPSLTPRRRTLLRRLHYSKSIVWWRQCYSMGRHSRAWQDTISCCCRKSDRNTLSGWNCSALCYSVHPRSV
jgi:hypothetical protein